MQERKTGFWQNAWLRVDDQLYRQSERIALVTGSGNNGQSYLYWRDDALYELPVSFFRQVGTWVNSPGFADGSANFARPITGRCLECHSTWFEQVPDTINRFRPEGYILGVTCERCHGPALKHLQFHMADPSPEPHFIVNPGKLPRDRCNEICAQCHSGEGVLKTPAFSFRPGQVLADHVTLSDKPSPNPGIHTNTQLLRLQESRCFTGSGSLTCATCHDPHQNEHGRVDVISARCQKCHAVADCAKEPEFGAPIADWCGACHLPRVDTNDTHFFTRSRTVGLGIHDHLIRRATDPEVEAILRGAPVPGR